MAAALPRLAAGSIPGGPTAPRPNVDEIGDLLSGAAPNSEPSVTEPTSSSVPF
jgi:hypothetical protein